MIRAATIKTARYLISALSVILLAIVSLKSANSALLALCLPARVLASYRLDKKKQR